MQQSGLFTLVLLREEELETRKRKFSGSMCFNDEDSQ